MPSTTNTPAHHRSLEEQDWQQAVCQPTEHHPTDSTPPPGHGGQSLDREGCGTAA